MQPKVQKTLERWAPLTALVGQNIFQDIIPEGVTGDRCIWQIIDAVPENNLAALPEEDRQRVQLDAYSLDPKRARLIGSALLDAMESVTHVIRGPVHSFEADTKLHRWSLDAGYWTEREGGQQVPLQIPFGGVKTADFNVDATSRAYRLEVMSPASLNAFLPSARNCPGALYVFDTGSSDGTMQIVPTGADTIEGVSGPASLSPLSANKIYLSDGVSNFMVI